MPEGAFLHSEPQLQEYQKHLGSRAGKDGTGAAGSRLRVNSEQARDHSRRGLLQEVGAMTNQSTIDKLIEIRLDYSGGI